MLHLLFLGEMTVFCRGFNDALLGLKAASYMYKKKNDSQCSGANVVFSTKKHIAHRTVSGTAKPIVYYSEQFRIVL
jgi:hypothetical protein